MLRTGLFFAVLFFGLWRIAHDVRAGLIAAPLVTVIYIWLDSRPPRENGRRAMWR